MQANLSVLESLQKIAGTTGGDNLVFNNSLPLFFEEYQKNTRLLDCCTVIVDSIKDVDGASILVSAISDTKSKIEDDLLGLKQKMSKEVSEGLDVVDMSAFQTLDESTQAELKMTVAGDPALLAVS